MTRIIITDVTKMSPELRAAWRRRWPRFTPAEMACHCCGRAEIDSKFMDCLQALRDACGFPLIVTSGYRCPAHNMKIAHTGAAGPHTTGHAVDIKIYGSRARALLSAISGIGFTGVGLKQSGPYTSRFIHLDDLSAACTRPRPWAWTY